MGTNTSSLPVVHKEVMQKGTRLTQQQRIQFNAPVTTYKIEGGLKAIGDEKALGIYGYNRASEA